MPSDIYGWLGPSLQMENVMVVAYSWYLIVTAVISHILIIYNLVILTI